MPKMEWKRLLYHVAVIVTALGMFLPLLYGYLPWVRKLLGTQPLLSSLAIIVIGWVVAYFTFEEEKREELTAS
ncbi:hypothetical protein [Thermococcus sp. 21S9]|uniref:hypothetical protein n=1 Tax=Thermococcus sp. 21S9 TaxID=1638223 RepID=UPI00143C9C80|nr:hypothetical protein [Thermococcus sp. 21S9]NJE54026.1 hypothetical protein [Thermococcus sp. 21S9]